MKNLVCLLFVAFLLVACGNNQLDSTITPPVVPANTQAAVAVTADATATVATQSTLQPTVTHPPPEPTAIPLTTSETAPTPTSTLLPSSLVSSIHLEPILNGGLSRPVFLTHAFDQRLFIVEQAGTVRVMESGELLDGSFLDIRDRVGSRANEQGLLSMAFHPQYANRQHPGVGRFFVNYTNKEGHTVIASFQASDDDPNQADPNSETILLTISQPFGNHNGGQVQFGPDGYLYVGTGDGGSGGDPRGNGQNPATLLGAILRLDVNQGDDESDYAIPENNPFVNNDSSRNEIWATGLRNPWRFSFDRRTNDLYIADVGQNQWEEVHFQPGNSRGGENYGWNIMEASHCYSRETCDHTGLELPIFEYDHRHGCSITGGYVYRGQQFPSLAGNYFAADFCSGAIWAIFRETEGTWSVSKLFESGLRISSFGEDVDGEIYVLDHGNGRVFQLQS